MQIPKNVLKLLNEQFYNELYASHLYFAMSAILKRMPYQGMAKWMRLQSKEEMAHAEKIYEFLVERDAVFATDAVAKPETKNIVSPLDAYKAAYAHEQLVTAQIAKIFELANEEKDWVTADLMNWFLKEQAEEEHTALAFVRGLEYAASDKNLLIAVDHWAGKRE